MTDQMSQSQNVKRVGMELKLKGVQFVFCVCTLASVLNLLVENG